MTYSHLYPNVNFKITKNMSGFITYTTSKEKTWNPFKLGFQEFSIYYLIIRTQ